MQVLPAVTYPPYVCGIPDSLFIQQWLVVFSHEDKYSTGLSGLSDIIMMKGRSSSG